MGTAGLGAVRTSVAVQDEFAESPGSRTDRRIPPGNVPNPAEPHEGDRVCDVTVKPLGILRAASNSAPILAGLLIVQSSVKLAAEPTLCVVGEMLVVAGTATVRNASDVLRLEPTVVVSAFCPTLSGYTSWVVLLTE